MELGMEPTQSDNDLRNLIKDTIQTMGGNVVVGLNQTQLQYQGLVMQWAGAIDKNVGMNFSVLLPDWVYHLYRANLYWKLRAPNYPGAIITGAPSANIAVATNPHTHNETGGVTLAENQLPTAVATLGHTHAIGVANVAVAIPAVTVDLLDSVGATISSQAGATSTAVSILSQLTNTLASHPNGYGVTSGFKDFSIIVHTAGAPTPNLVRVDIYLDLYALVKPVAA